MEYTKELEHLQKEVSNPGKPVEDLSDIVKSFSKLSSLQDTIKKFQEDSVLSRLETKVDIIAQSDYTGIINILIDDLKEGLTQEFLVISKKIDDLKFSAKEDFSKDKTSVDDSSIELKQAIDAISQRFSQYHSDLNAIKESIPGIIDFEKFDDLESIIKSQESSILKSLSDIYKNTSGINNQFKSLNDSLHHKLNTLEQNILNKDNSSVDEIKKGIAGITGYLREIKSKLQSSYSKKINTEGSETIQEQIEVGPVSYYENAEYLESIQSVHEKLDALQEKIDSINPSNNRSGIDIDIDYEPIYSELEEIKSKIYAQEDISGRTLILLEEMEKGPEFDEIKAVIGQIVFDTIKPSDEKIEQLITGLQQSNNSQNNTKNELNKSIGLLKEELTGIKERLQPVHGLNSISESLHSIQESLNLFADDLSTNKVDHFEARNNFENIRGLLDSLNKSLKSIKNDINDKTDFNLVENSLHSINGNISLLLEHSGENRNGQSSLYSELEGIKNCLLAQDDIVQKSYTLLEKADSKDEIEEIKDSIGLVVCDKLRSTEEKINQVIFNLNQKSSAQYELKDEFSDSLNNIKYQIDYLKDHLYPVHNLQAVSENLLSIQDKVSMLVESLDINRDAFSLVNDSFVELAGNISEQNIGLKNHIWSAIENSANGNIAIQKEIKIELEDIKNNITAQDDIAQKSYTLLENTASAEAVREIREAIGSIICDNFQPADEKLNKLVTDLNTNNFVQYAMKEEFGSALGVLKQQLDDLSRNLYPVHNLQAVSENLEAMQDKLNMLVGSIETDREAYAAIDNNFKELSGNISEQNYDLKNSIGSVYEVSDKISRAIAYLENDLNEIKENTGDKTELINIKNDFQDVKQSISSLNSEIYSFRQENNTNIATNMGQFDEKLSSIDSKISVLSESFFPMENLQHISEQFYSAQDKINALVNLVSANSPENIKNTLKLEDKFENISFKIDSEVVYLLNSVKDCLDELDGKQNSFEEIKSAISFLHHGMENLSENLKYGTSNNISEGVLETLLNDINTIKSSINTDILSGKINEINEKITDFDSKISGLQEISYFKENFNFLKDSISQLEEKFNYTNEKISELVNTKPERKNEDIVPLNGELDELKNALTVRMNHNAEVLNEFLGIFNNKLEAISGKEEIHEMKEGVYFLSESARNSSDILNGLCNDIHSLGSIQEKVDSLAEQLHIVSTSAEVGELNSKMEALSEEIKQYRDYLASSNNTNNEIINAILDNLISLNERIDFVPENNNSKVIEKLERLEEIHTNNQTGISDAIEAISSAGKEISTFADGFNRFDDDLTDISSKVNRLILENNENTGSLKENIREEFNNLKTEIKNDMENINSVSLDGLNSSKEIKQAIIQMADWLDSAGKLLEDNNKNSKKSLTINKKFDNFEVRLENIEAKLEKLIDREYKDK